MFYVGLDIHTKRIAFCVLSDKGQLVQRGQVRGLDEVLRILKALPDRFEVCYEASCGYGRAHRTADASGHNVSMWSPPVAVRQRDPHQGVE
jgi:hypothetical protein